MGEGKYTESVPSESGDGAANAAEKPQDIKQTVTFKQRIENFWYHYKWHTIAALFVLTVGIIIAVQMLSKPKYDVYVMYAGGHYFDTTDSADTSSYREALSAIKRVSEDFDGNGEVSVSFSHLYIPTGEGSTSGDAAADLSGAALKSQDASTLNDRLTGGEYYVILLSPELYEVYVEDYGEILFVPLASYGTEGRAYEYYGEYGDAVYLRSTGLYSLPGISDLPEDTLIVLRSKGAIDSTFSKKQTEKNFTRSESVIRNILALPTANDK